MHVLVCDDDPTMCELLTDILGGFGHHVVTAADAEGALVVLEGTAFDIILLDGKLPKMSGPTLAAQLGDSVPIVAVTGDRVSAREFRQLGIETIRKPFSVPELMAAIDVALGMEVLMCE